MTAPTILVLHGDQLIPLALGVLLLVVAVLSGLAYILVKVLRGRLGRQSRLVALLPFLVFALAVAGWIWVESPNQGPPKTLPGSELPRLVRGLPDYAPFSFSGAAYFRGHLYLGSNVGLLQIDDGRVTSLYQFQRTDSVVSGPWLDRANDLLWLLDEHTHELVSFNGSQWRRVPMPTPAKGYYTRGEVLEGVKAASAPRGFWLASGGSAWRWIQAEERWHEEPSPVPPQSFEDTLVGVIPLEAGAAFLVRHQALSYLVKPGDDFKSDTATFIGASQRHEISNQSEIGFLAESWVSTTSGGYICDRSGNLWHLTPLQIQVTKTPGVCEAISVDSVGTLIASFRERGIFRLDNQLWRQLCAAAPSAGKGEYWAYLAASDGNISYVTSARPVVDKERTTGKDMRFTRNADTAAWVLRGNELVKIPVN